MKIFYKEFIKYRRKTLNVFIKHYKYFIKSYKIFIKYL